MSESLGEFQGRVANACNELLQRYWLQRFEDATGEQTRLREAIHHSVFAGGKRMRPLLSVAVGEALGDRSPAGLVWGTAVEMIHAYSLVHDDLPCMDNADLRRGLPTTHKKYGETVALLAGDALLTEAFHFLVSNLRERAEVLPVLISLLADAAGVRGMIGGQMSDLHYDEMPATAEALTRLHEQKTGALFRVAAQGAALLADVSESQVEAARQFGLRLGLVFQVADDLLDHNPEAPEKVSFVRILGVPGVQRLQEQLVTQAEDQLKSLRGDPIRLVGLLKLAAQRSH